MLTLSCRENRELQQSADDVIPIEMRLEVSIPGDDICLLIQHLQMTSYFRPTAEQLGWDICRHPDAYDNLESALVGLRDPESYDLVTEVWGSGSDEAEAALREHVERRLESFKRPRLPTDLLLIDQIDHARHQGFEPSAYVDEELKRLEQVASATRDKLQAERVAMRLKRLEQVVAESEAEEAQAEAELEAIERRLLDSDADEESEEYRLIECRFLSEKAEWVKQYGKRLWPDVYGDRRPKDQNSAVPPCTEQIPAEILEQYKRQREQYEAALIGPLPEHPDLTADQANVLVKYWAHLPTGKILYESTREMWNASSVDKHIGRIKDAMTTGGPGKQASTWLSQFRAVQSMGWAPGEPMIIENKVLTKDGWLRSAGDRTFNLYVPPDIEPIEGDVSMWRDHVKSIYPNEWQHIVLWCAHRVQRPGEKVNHCLDFIGPQGIGKDTILVPVIAAIGSQNFKQITAKDFYNSEWNDYLQSVILRINEIHDLGGESRYGFYDATKDAITAPPEMHRINTKFVPQYAAVNVCGVIMTSNHLDALYIPRDDRRHFVCVSNRTKEEFKAGYFDDMHAWFRKGGNEAVAHYLANLDLSAFDAHAPPPKTAGWEMVAAAGLAPESSDLADIIEAMGNPAAVTIRMLRSKMPADSQLRSMFEDPKQRKYIPKRLADCGYIAVANPDTLKSGGRWRVSSEKTTIYAKQTLSETERLDAARNLSLRQSPPPPPPPMPPER